MGPVFFYVVSQNLWINLALVTRTSTITEGEPPPNADEVTEGEEFSPWIEVFFVGYDSVVIEGTDVQPLVTALHSFPPTPPRE